MTRNSTKRATALLASIGAFAPAAYAAGPAHDTVLRNGLIYDGSGQPTYPGAELDSLVDACLRG